MTAPSTTTPPQELFRELAALGNLTFNMLTGPQVGVKRWPAYYMVYLEVERLCWEVSRTAGYLSRSFIKPDGTVDHDRIKGANACLARIDGHFRTMVDLLVLIERRELVSHGKPALKEIVYNHFSPKSAWYLACQEQYCSGRVSTDGRILERAVLQLDMHPAITFGVGGMGAESLVQRQKFELVSAQSQTLLGRTTRKVQTELNQLYAALGDFFVERCPSVSELLHPRMN